VDAVAQYWAVADGVTRGVALLLLAMSVAAWVLIFWKVWLLRRVTGDTARALGAFWDAAGVDDGRQRLAGLDRECVLQPLVDAALAQPAPGTLDARGDDDAQITRRLRDALHGSVARLQTGQVVLASVGSTAPFVGLFGTVWSLYHALVGMAVPGGQGLEAVAGPLGEALLMTAAGIAVAVPAVLAYNLCGTWIGRLEAEFEGFAFDVRRMALGETGRRAADEGPAA
jgi:biopolymer transport protein ExbB